MKPLRICNFTRHTRPVRTKQAYFGGRINAAKLYHKVSGDEQIKYYDVTFLYPFGIAKIKILPPRKLYHPVLPLKVNGKLLFPLCGTCEEKQNQEKCTCTDVKRCLLGTWCTPEIEKAVEKGYMVIKI